MSEQAGWQVNKPLSNKWVICESMWPLFTGLVLMAALHRTTAAQGRDCGQRFHSINLNSAHETTYAVCAKLNWWLEWQESKMPHVPTADKLHLLHPSKHLLGCGGDRISTGMWNMTVFHLQNLTSQHVQYFSYIYCFSWSIGSFMLYIICNLVSLGLLLI